MWLPLNSYQFAVRRIATAFAAPKNRAVQICRVPRFFLQHQLFSAKSKHKRPTKVRPEEVEEEEEFFDIDDYIGKIRETESTTLSAIEQLKPVAMTLEDLEIIQVMDKDLSDLSQIVLKSPVVVHLHVFDVKNKSKIVRELTLLRDDWNVQPDVDDLIIIRMPSPNSSQVMKAVAGKAAKIQEKHQQQVQQIVAKANAMIKRVNIGNNWHRKQYDLLNNATKSANERIKAAIKRLTSV